MNSIGHFVSNESWPGTTSRVSDIINPATGGVIGMVTLASKADVDAVVQTAADALPGWSATPPAKRAMVLFNFRDLLKKHMDELAALLSAEHGKTLPDAKGEIARGIEVVEFACGIPQLIKGEYSEAVARNVDCFSVRQPVGVVAGITPFNFPAMVPLWMYPVAIACGNTFILKPSEKTPSVVMRIAELLAEAGLPAGVFNVIQGLGDVGASLVTDARVAKVSLTGSVPTGRKVYAAAADTMKHVTMELGGKSPLIIFEDANLEDAISGAINANFYSSGQVCSNGTRVFVHADIKEAFLTRLAERMQGAVIGDPMDEATNFGPMINARQLEITEKYIAAGKAEGARLICGGDRVDRPGNYITPAVFADVTDDMSIAREEVFGPLMSVLDFTDEDEVIARANDTEFGLAAGVFTRDLTRGHRVVGKLEAGSTWINQYNLTPVETPFGGSKMSGVGRENGQVAINHWSELKTVYVGMTPVEAAF